MRRKLLSVAAGLAALGLFASPEPVSAGALLAGPSSALANVQSPVQKAGYYGRGFGRLYGYQGFGRYYGYRSYRPYRYRGYRRSFRRHRFGGYRRHFGFRGHRGGFRFYY